ncbi:hypothetical protein E2C01_004804 [Portunus trituberculatus]|uniref:Uncharacterized protein n=1 Tax=Portunus trituberculatus TaxID=210409 RepID=A0A5B7CUW8_PORTR|nr:hypothetical protein [Portunus trituberculatus]
MTVTVAERGPVNKGLAVAFTLTKKPNETSGLWTLGPGGGCGWSRGRKWIPSLVLERDDQATLTPARLSVRAIIPVYEPLCGSPPHHPARLYKTPREQLSTSSTPPRGLIPCQALGLGNTRRPKYARVTRNRETVKVKCDDLQPLVPAATEVPGEAAGRRRCHETECDGRNNSRRC